MAKDRSAAVVGAVLTNSLHADRAVAQAGQFLEGSWTLDITVVATGAKRTTLLTFNPDGTVVTTGSDHPTRSPGHGARVRTGDREFVATWWQLLFDQEGTYSGKLRNRLHLQLNGTLDEMDAQGQPETFDLAGNLLTSGHTATHGARIRAEAPD
jgi:hypothetical protein